MRRFEKESINKQKRESHIVRKLVIFFVIIAAIVGISFISIYLYSKFDSQRITAKHLEQYWKSNAENKYELVYDEGKQLLQQHPFNNKALIYYGYACFFLGVSQTDSSIMQSYLDECILSLRQSLYNAKTETKPQICYMLGKAYYYKNKITENYYADLTVKYLTEAMNLGYEADDIHEYLGMSYAALDMHTESIAAFSEALLVRESDNLLVSIAEEYKKCGQFSSAKQYLFRVIKSSENEELIEKSRLLLANIYLEEEDYTNAMQEFSSVLKNNENSTDAHYGIGVIYEKQGNIVKARAEWRNALKIQGNHPGALKKLSEYKR